MKRPLEASFQELSESIPATIGIAIATGDGETISWGQWSTGVAWSTIKVPLAVAALRAGISSDELVVETITHSDNAAAEELWSRLGGSASPHVESIIREAGDPLTVVESRRLRAEFTPFGQTKWSLADQARFAAGLSQVPGASRVVDLMSELCIDHRWGLATKGFAAKGGWGPGRRGEYLVRQFAIVSETVGVALAADVGDHETGVAVINTLAQWVVDEALAK